MKYLSYEEELEMKDEREQREKPLERLNRKRTQRLEEAFFEQIRNAEEDYIGE